MFKSQRSMKPRVKGNRKCQILANLLAAKIGAFFYLRLRVIFRRRVMIFLAELTAPIMVFAAFLAAPTKVFVAFLALRVTFFDAAEIFLRVRRFLNALNAFIGLFMDRPPNILLIKANLYFYVTPANGLYWGGLERSSYALLF